MNTSLHLLGQK